MAPLPHSLLYCVTLFRLEQIIGVAELYDDEEKGGGWGVLQLYEQLTPC